MLTFSVGNQARICLGFKLLYALFGHEIQSFNLYVTVILRIFTAYPHLLVNAELRALFDAGFWGLLPDIDTIVPLYKFFLQKKEWKAVGGSDLKVVSHFPNYFRI